MALLHCWVCMLLVSVSVVYASKGHSYYYPPVYGNFKEADYAPAALHKDSKSKVSYYYPPVYGKVTDRVYSASATQDKGETSQFSGRPSYSPHHVTSSYHRRRVAPSNPVRAERTYEHPEKQRTVVYRPPEKKSYPKKKTQKCFQCEYSPPKPIHYEVLVTEPYDVKIPKTVQECEWDRTIEYVYEKPKRGSRQMYGRYKEVPKYEKTCYPRTIFETKTKYRTRYVKKQKMGSSGGFEACKGPLDTYSAKKSGVDDWDCHSNCYVKKDKSGTVTRGCYSGQYKVEPTLLGCHYQGDNKQDLYCFCQGDHCNGQSVPSTRSSQMSYDY